MSADATIDALAARVYAKIPSRIVLETRVPRRPFFIEFSGTPKSGKSFISERLATLLRHNQFKVLYVPEAAAVNPLSRKEDVKYNVWNALTTLCRIMTEADQRAHIVILDRGLFDALFWMEWRLMTGRVTDEEHQTITNFLLMKQWRKLIDMVFLLQVDPGSAHERDTVGLTAKVGGVMNPPTLAQLNEAVDRAAQKYGSLFRAVHRVDTTALEPAKGLRRVATMALETFEKFIQERVVVVERSAVAGVLITNRFVYKDDPSFSQLLELIKTHADVEIRSTAEGDVERMKIVCGALLVSNGRVLFLRRREENPQHPMHNKYVIWAGGHARDEDLDTPDFFQDCLRRELEEELAIKTRYEIRPLGYLCDTSTASSSCHILILYEARLASDDVTISMTEREFKDKTGMSVSGMFFQPEDTLQYWEEMEPWSRAVLMTHFGVQPPVRESASLFHDLPSPVQTTSATQRKTRRATRSDARSTSQHSRRRPHPPTPPPPDTTLA